MSILWRSWISFTAIIATVLITLAALSSLQHKALYRDISSTESKTIRESVEESDFQLLQLNHYM